MLGTLLEYSMSQQVTASTCPHTGSTLSIQAPASCYRYASPLDLGQNCWMVIQGLMNRWFTAQKLDYGTNTIWCYIVVLDGEHTSPAIPQVTGINAKPQ